MALNTGRPIWRTPALRDEIEQAVNGEIRRREYLARGLDSAAIREVEQTHAPFASLNPKKEAGREAVSGVDIVRQWAPSGFVYLLWVAIFTISQMLLNNIIEEKSNRIIEVLLSSVTPGELMMGKLLGIAAIGLTLVGAWMAALFGALSWNSGSASGPRRPASSGVENIEFGPDVSDLLPAGIRHVCGLHPRARQCVQHHQGGAELHGHDYDGHDGPAAYHDLYPEGPQPAPSPGCFPGSRFTLPSP